MLVPFLVSRQLICGAGKVLHTARGAEYSVSQRAEHIWESVSSATTRSRPIINTRDEPHADPERYRRLHVIVGDSNMSETTTLLKVGSAELVLRLIEAGVPMRDLTLENPIRAIRDMSRDRDRTGHGGAVQRPSGLGAGSADRSTTRRSASSSAARDWAPRRSTGCSTCGSGPCARSPRTSSPWSTPRSTGRSSRSCWTGTRPSTPLGLADPRIAQLDLAYHDIRRGRGLFDLLEARGMAARVTDEPAIFRAKSVPPQTTRAKLRGDFIRAAQEGRNDYTVDWVHLKLNDQAQRTVLCKDPFLATDERVDRLIASMRAPVLASLRNARRRLSQVPQELRRSGGFPRVRGKPRTVPSELPGYSAKNLGSAAPGYATAFPGAGLCQAL